jgi:DNA-binding CsgD family transcriptional regulator
MEGNTLDQCCDHLNIRPSTARMHLGSLFAKTGVQRQGQLISLLLKSLGMVCLTSGERRPGRGRSGRDLHEGNRPREVSSSRSREILAASLKALDLLDIGMAVTNSSRQLLFANQTAEHILVTRDGVEVAANGVVDTLTKACRPSLGEVMREVVRAAISGVSEPKDAILAVERRDGTRPLTLLIRSVIEPLSRLDRSDPALLVFLFDPTGPVRATESGLRQLYKLTATEARIASLLMEGKTLDDCCEDLDIRPSTARMHLGNLFAKTGVQRQGQLISLFLKSFGMLRSEGTTSRS